MQYRIFDAVYGVAGDAQDTALVLIGDPKQAIYAFRGADIHTYLAARRDTAGRHATLGTNFRSSEAMVAAVNHVFMQAEAARAGRRAHSCSARLARIRCPSCRCERVAATRHGSATARQHRR